jgi:hypothetical protein
MSIRLTNNPETYTAMTKIQYVDRIVEVPVHVMSEPIVHLSTPEIQYVDRVIEVEKRVEVPVIHMVESSVSFETLEKFDKQILNQEKISKSIITELEMQRRALVALKTQRDIDRSRRLLLIQRMKKAHTAHKKQAFMFKLAISASLILSVTTLLIKL